MPTIIDKESKEIYEMANIAKKNNKIRDLFYSNYQLRIPLNSSPQSIVIKPPISPKKAKNIEGSNDDG